MQEVVVKAKDDIRLIFKDIRSIFKDIRFIFKDGFEKCRSYIIIELCLVEC